MKSLARQLDTSSVTANVFRQMGAVSENSPLVIDAFDELAKIDQSGIHKLLRNAKKANPTHVIISSRSSEWDNAATKEFENFLGHQPLVVRLYEFEEAEQRKIFENHLQGEDFTAFQSEVSRFDLETLLPNPQFLKLFADAYIESERHFTDKRSIFAQAVERLAKESNTNVAKTNSPLSTTQKVKISSEVFAKLLLSGAEGVGTSEATEDRMHPLLSSLHNNYTEVYGILATRLFKPGDSADQHRPVHKIVAEYCAADFLTKRIADPSNPLTLANCLTIIAPNDIVRDELRGLLGWMASIGNKPIQRAAISLDPYAVLANGDPSQLEHSSKRLLIKRLKEIESRDPLFRRGDYWRRFSVAGFFTQDVLDEIKPLLATGGDGDLRDLILELLAGSPAAEQLIVEMQQLTLAPGESKNTRLLASRCLINLPGHDHHADLAALISEASHTSLNVAAEAIEKLNSETFDLGYFAHFFRQCANLYPNHRQRFGYIVGERYFVRRFIAGLSFVTIKWLLDELTKDLVCKCGKNSYECDCLNGMSKIIGLMLDRYFELASAPHDPNCIWQWVKNLNFHESQTAERSLAVKVLQEDDVLHKGIIALVFAGLTDTNQIREAKYQFFGLHSHSGLYFHVDDNKFIVDLAFETDNPNLWTSFILEHDYYSAKDKRGPVSMRQYMRQQALEKPSLMRAWVKSNRSRAQSYKNRRMIDVNHERKIRRDRRKRNDIRAKNIKYIQENRSLVESGRHWYYLVQFARLTLNAPDTIERKMGEVALVRNALRNCLDVIAPSIPNLLELAELNCASSKREEEIVLFAACLEIMRVEGNLENVNIELLKALRTSIHRGYNAVAYEDRDALKAEVDRLIFPDTESAGIFLREYVEPQLELAGCANPEIWLLEDDEVFSHFRASLSIEWLRRFRGLPLSPLDRLFNIAAQYGNRDELEEIILERCKEFICCPTAADNENFEKTRIFWFVRAWYFQKTPPSACWDYLKTDRDTVLILNELSGSMRLRDRPYWPKLTSSKIEDILNAFFDKWPKVALPSSWGNESPKEEIAYRFLTSVIWLINSDAPEAAIPVLGRLTSNPIFSDFHKSLKSIHSSQIRKKALRAVEPPTPEKIVGFLDCNEVVTVEGLRQLVIQELQDLQGDIDGGEFNLADLFYAQGQRLDETRSTEIIAERVKRQLEPQDISVTLEQQLKARTRCDFTATKMISGEKRLLVIEVKGQWHKELYTAASAQLHDRYTIHPNAEQQGIYLVIWFGKGEKVAGVRKHAITSAQELKRKIEATLPPELTGLIDVFVLDVSRP